MNKKHNNSRIVQDIEKVNEIAFFKKLRSMGVEEVKVAQKIVKWGKKWMSPINPWSGKQKLSFRPILNHNNISCKPIALYADPEGLMIGIKSMIRVTALKDKVPDIIKNIKPFADEKIISKDLRVRWHNLKNEKNLQCILETLDWIIQIKDMRYSETTLKIENEILKEGFLPTRDDFESAYRMVCSPGQKIDKESILNQIESNATNSGYNFKENWRLITERNIEIWVNGAETLGRPVGE